MRDLSERVAKGWKSEMIAPIDLAQYQRWRQQGKANVRRIEAHDVRLRRA